MIEKFKQTKNLAKKAGFTVVELLVVIGIFTVITGVILFNYSDFSNRASVQNLAQDIALTVRQAQVFTLGIKTGSGSTNIRGYGVHFDIGDPKSFVLFSDKEVPAGSSGKSQYDNAGTRNCVAGTECVEKVTIKSADCIWRVRYQDTGGNNGSEQFDTANFACNEAVKNVSNSSGPVSLSRLKYVDISFERPNPDANVMLYEVNQGSPRIRSNQVKWVAIDIISPKGFMKTIKVVPTGLITIEDTL